MSSSRKQYRHNTPNNAVSSLVVPPGDNSNVHNGTNNVNNSNAYHSSMTPGQYLTRLTDVSQMDLQSALDQMRSLITFSPASTQKVYKMAYYRKQTKNHWARDDPAFVAIQIVFLLLSCLAYCIAFRSTDILSNTVSFAIHSIFLNYVLTGIIAATAFRAIANLRLAGITSTSHVRQTVEWMYAFDIHCNAFFPLYVLLYGLQYFLLPLVLRNTLLAFLISNTLFAFAFSWYFYVTHLGYRALPFLSNTEVYLFPVFGIVFLFILNLVGYPFNYGYNASRVMAHLYFEL